MQLLLCWVLASIFVTALAVKVKDRAIKARGDTRVYTVYAGTRHHVQDWETFVRFGYHDFDIEEVSKEELVAIPEGFPFLRMGTLDPVVKAREDASVYMVHDGARHKIPDWKAFIGLGYDNDAINHISLQTLSGLPLPQVHPDGTKPFQSSKLRG